MNKIIYRVGFLSGLIAFAPIGLIIALIKKPAYKLVGLFNFYTDMYWTWTYCIYIPFALIIWILIEMIFLQAVQWLHTVYMFFAIAILFFALLPQVKNEYKKGN